MHQLTPSQVFLTLWNVSMFQNLVAVVVVTISNLYLNGAHEIPDTYIYYITDS